MAEILLFSKDSKSPDKIPFCVHCSILFSKQKPFFTDDSEAKFLAQYLVELTLMDAQTYLHFLPSVIGAAGVALARHTLGNFDRLMQ
jgi:hypothetical protein